MYSNSTVKPTESGIIILHFFNFERGQDTYIIYIILVDFWEVRVIWDSYCIFEHLNVQSILSNYFNDCKMCTDSPCYIPPIGDLCHFGRTGGNEMKHVTKIRVLKRLNESDVFLKGMCLHKDEGKR